MAVPMCPGWRSARRVVLFVTTALLALPGAALAAQPSALPAPGGGPAAAIGQAPQPAGNGFGDGKSHARIRESDASGPAAPGDYAIPAAHGRPPLPAHAGGKSEGLGRSAPSTTSLDYLLYRGGWTQTSPRLYIVYWGDWSSASDVYNVQNRLYYFLSGVGGSAWNRTATEYAYNCGIGTFSCPSTAVHIQNTPNQLQSWWKDTSAVPAVPTDADVANEAKRAAAHFGDYSVNAQYVVALPRGHDPGYFPTHGGDVCAYHSWFTAASAAVSFTSLPYLPDAGRGCGNYSVNNSILDGVTIVESHEYNEAETDPFVSGTSTWGGWTDSTGSAGEAGDKCSGGATYNANTSLSTGTFPIQSVWSNYYRYYYNSGCRFFS
jgi:hypothetical protein